MKLDLFALFREKDPTNWSEANEIFYAKYLDQFERDVYPMFKRRGYKRDTALVVVMMIDLSSTLNALYKKNREE